MPDPGRFRPLNALTPDGAHNAIPVPSRLYQKPPNPDRPLSNVRVTIPDTMSLKGVHTTLSSKAWSSLHPTASTSTAQLAQKLIDLGAVIVGKTKTSQFDVGQDWVDATAPWNPRADGYQTPHGPSAGAASALAGYGWLQHSIGQDCEFHHQTCRKLQLTMIQHLKEFVSWQPPKDCTPFAHHKEQSP